MRSVTSSSCAPGETSSLDAPKLPSGQVGGDSDPPGGVAATIHTKNPWRGGDQLEPIVIQFNRERRVQMALGGRPRLDLLAKPEVDVLGHPSVVSEANLQCHPSLEDPAARLGCLEAGDDALEQDAPPEPIESEAGLVPTG